VGKATVLVNASTLSMHHIGEAMNHVGQLMLPNRTDQRMLPNRTDQQHTKTHQNTPKHTNNTPTTHLEEGSGTTLSKELRRSSRKGA
jgi:hypothetical protein